MGTDKHHVRPVRLSIFCLYGRGYTPQQFIATFTTGHPDPHVQHLFASVLGPPSTTGGQNCTLTCKRYVFSFLSGICRLCGSGVELAVDYAAPKGAGNEIMVKELSLSGNNVI
jgi:hypothetical protein